MKKRYNMTSVQCPRCYSRRIDLVAQTRKFSWSRAADGMILSGILGGGLAGGLYGLSLGLGAKQGPAYVRCRICGKVWKEPASR